jgi:hypothetical protein
MDKNDSPPMTRSARINQNLMTDSMSDELDRNCELLLLRPGREFEIKLPRLHCLTLERASSVRLSHRPVQIRHFKINQRLFKNAGTYDLKECIKPDEICVTIAKRTKTACEIKCITMRQHKFD